MLQNEKQQLGLMVEDEALGVGMMGLLSANPNSFLPHQFDSDSLFLNSCPKPQMELLSLHQASNPWWEWGCSGSKEGTGMMEGDNESLEEDYDDTENRKKNKKSSAGLGVEMKTKTKTKTKTRRKVREPRFSFKTLSDVDVLDDGYKWRKYGQKVVKNTHHPRSYYRCTQDKCRVKKKVERLAEDPRMVITTYEGRHSHSPAPQDDNQNPRSNITNFFFF